MIAATAAAAVLVAGCGSSANATHTTTVSEHQVAAQDQTLQNCGLSTTPACQAAWSKATSAPTVIRCGAGLNTNSSCVFASNVARAYQTAEKSYGKAPTGMTVTTNPVACSGTPGAWHCRSRRNTAVWVSYTKP
jgi:hypothetical protein